ncbi:TraV family lipoprotein [Methylomonas rapida]|uniref:TraV family lipoprotein n=1 Tax=Methylomonas rapida TaxID=2963939 RepID=A0ABY7GDE9_9GAMM|nr:TraV family lipoprotein [Methylomonas rapida]WAR43310.1 TraV family lipoprotein [Methylomonas rapida]WAR43544.1 TraV family lipoprotein [Methylomonas rapida]
MNRYCPFPLVLSSLTWMFVTGCATQYGCQGMPDEPSCLSTTQAYQVTNTAIAEAPPENSQNSESTSSPAIVPPLQQPVPKIEDPTPIRTPSQVMRIWIAPWEDADGDLMVSNYVYTELEPRRWMIGKAVPTSSTSLIPLQVEQRPPEKWSSVDTPEDESPVNRLGKQLP